MIDRASAASEEGERAGRPKADQARIEASDRAGRLAPAIVADIAPAMIGAARELVTLETA